MADFIIKPDPGTGNKIILKDQAGNAFVTSTDNGANFTLGSASVFPTGHIVQCQYNPSIVSNNNNHTSEAVAASVTNQISITSGNGVLIYVQAGALYLDRDSADMGFWARIRQGTTTSGTVLSAVTERHTAHPSNWHTNVFLMGYDPSPPDTSPDYCLTLERISSGAHYVKLNYTGAEYLKFFLFEVQQ